MPEEPEAPRSSDPQRSTTPWWVAPWSLAAMMILPTVTMAYLVSESYYRTNWRYPKFVSGKTVVWVVGLFLALVPPMVIVARERMRTRQSRSWLFTPRELKVLRRCNVVLLILTGLGYTIYTAIGASNGFTFSQVTGNASALETTEQFEQVTGITTMTQFGIAASVVGALLWPQAKRWERWAFITLVTFAALRGYVVSERLAVVEVVVPAGVIVVTRAFSRLSSGSWKRTLIVLVPVLTVPALIVGFTLYERNRSWPWYRDHTYQQSIWHFGADRLVAYYSTSYNNAELIRSGTWPRTGALPYVTIEGLWTAPVLGDLLPYSDLTDGETFRYRYWTALGEISNREFNNTGGITSATIDYGPAGGLVFCALLGSLIGAGYAAFSQRRRWGLLFYPLFVMGLLEFSRVFYLGTGRAVPAFLGLLYVAARLRKARRQDARWGLGPRPTSPDPLELAARASAQRVRELHVPS